MPQKVNLDISAFVLDDDKDLLYLIERKLQGNKLFNYRLFFDTELFLNSLTDEIRVVVIDHKLMSGQTGLDIVKQVKHMNRENFVIGYSSVTDPKILIDYINSDIDRFIDKDHEDHIDRLVDAIKEGLIEASRRTAFYNYFQTQLKRHDL